MMPPKVPPGRPYPLGATPDERGVNFALFSEHATRVEVCLFDSPRDLSESAPIALPERTDAVWHGYVEGLRPGQLYGIRVSGPYTPEAGHRFNPNKLLLDPYARGVAREVVWRDELAGYRVADAKADLSFDDRDSAPFAPLGMVVQDDFDWGDDARPATPWHETIIYEAHVKGLTQLHPDVPKTLRGTYLGLASEPVIRHLKELGVTAVEILPVHMRFTERHLSQKRLTNCWGYNTLAYFAPDPRFASSRDPLAALREFKTMVRSLHRAGLEVILDVVYNHTAEGDHLGPTLSFRGIDNMAYYALDPDDPSRYVNTTGCGNSVNARHPRVLQLIADSLRYWAEEMHVDGFRFDLATTLARGGQGVERHAAFTSVIQQDPLLAQLKLIAEPWDLGEGGYQVGRFPVGWAEWNGKYRDAARRFWRGEGGLVGEMASRLTGSSDLYEASGRGPHASINFVTAHDGFSLRDLVSYDHKHNEANGEGNRDGEQHNLSWNCGTEGPTQDPAIMELRQRQMRNFMATLLLSLGVPMLRAGDELSHTSHGNNNTYSQDNELNWLGWNLDGSKKRFLEFVRNAAALRKAHPVLRRRRFLTGKPSGSSGLKDLAWLRPDGQEMTPADWAAPFARAIGYLLSGEADSDDTLLALLNAHHDVVPFQLPSWGESTSWELLLDTVADSRARSVIEAGRPFPLRGRSVALLRRLPRSR